MEEHEAAQRWGQQVTSRAWHWARTNQAGDTAGQGTSRTINLRADKGFGHRHNPVPSSSPLPALLSSCMHPETPLQTEGLQRGKRQAGRHVCLLLKAFGARGRTAFNHQAGGKQPSPGITSCCPAPDMDQPQRFNLPPRQGGFSPPHPTSLLYIHVNKSICVQ